MTFYVFIFTLLQCAFFYLEDKQWIAPAKGAEFIDPSLIKYPLFFLNQGVLFLKLESMAGRS